MPKNKVDLQALKKRLYNRVHKTGEECNNDLPNILRVVIAQEAWRQDRDAEGKPFENLAAWLHYHWPSGLSLGCDTIAMTYTQLMAHCEGHKDVFDVLVRNAPKNKRGGDRKSKEATNKQNQNGGSSILIGGSGTAQTKSVLAVRLQERFPEHYQKYLNGEHKSVWAAAVASGLVKKSGHDPLARLKSNWKKATKKERDQFLAWISEQE